MYANINFLKERNRMQELTLIRDKKIATVTSVSLGVFLFATIALLAYQLFLRAQLGKVEAASALMQQKVQSLTRVQTIYVDVAKKLHTVIAIVGKRGNKWDAITYFYSLLPVGSTINSVDLQADVDNSLAFSIESSSVFSYDALSKVIQSESVKKGGYSLELGALSRAKDGTYRIDVTLKTITAANKPVPRTGGTSQ